MESYSGKKNRISLNDYNYKRDLENRLLMSQFSEQDLAALEEILYSSIRIPTHKLEKSLELTSEELLPILVKLSRTGLFSFEEEGSIVVDKEMRKYFEFQALKFESGFKPGMEFLQGLLRKVPIHTLPIWYAIPRLSDDIFESLVEKYLLTPQIFQRYLADLTFSDPLLSSIVEDVYRSEDLKVYGKTIIEKYSLSKEQFEEALLQLEFHLVCCLGYEKTDIGYQEIVTPFQEWRDYMRFLKQTEVKSIEDVEKVEPLRPEEFSYVIDLSLLLKTLKKQPLGLEKESEVLSSDSFALLSKKMGGFTGSETEAQEYITRIVDKACQLKLASCVEGRLLALDSSTDFLEVSTEEQALFLYRHPFNRSSFRALPPELLTDRNLREAEKGILRVLDSGWVYFDEFLQGVTIPLSDTSLVCLKKQGKTWKYSLPSYSEEELALIKLVILEWLFEVGITAVGSVNGKDCFCVTPFGKSLFGQ